MKKNSEKAPQHDSEKAIKELRDRKQARLKKLLMKEEKYLKDLISMSSIFDEKVFHHMISNTR